MATRHAQLVDLDASINRGEELKECLHIFLVDTASTVYTLSYLEQINSIFYIISTTRLSNRMHTQLRVSNIWKVLIRTNSIRQICIELTYCTDTQSCG
jgi:hypothetical protein